MKRIRRVFFAIFKIPENMMTFISGILLSASISIVTGQIVDTGIKWTHGWQVTISTILMFISSCCFTIMAIYLKPLQEKHQKEHPIEIRLKDTDIWFEDLKNKKGTIVVLVILFLLSYGSLVVSVILLFWEDIWGNILLPQGPAIPPMN